MPSFHTADDKLLIAIAYNFITFKAYFQCLLHIKRLHERGLKKYHLRNNAPRTIGRFFWLIPQGAFSWGRQVAATLTLTVTLALAR